MRIGVFVAFAGRNCGGPEVFERELVRSLVAVNPGHEYHVYCLDRHAPEVIGLQHPSVTCHVLKPSFRVISMITSLPRVVAQTQPDIFHAPMVTPPFCPKNTIMAVQCSSLIRHPEFFPPLVRLRLEFLLYRAIPKSAIVVCPSEHVREVVQEKFRLPDDRFRVIGPGVSPAFHPIAEEAKRHYLENEHDIRYPYFLLSGRWEARKNIVKTLEAFAHFKRTYKTEHKLVLTGGRSWGTAEVQAILDHPELKDMVVDLGKTPIDELPYLYAGAEALVYVSLWEGFGMPIIEAMACGTPVVTSNTSAMPETAGGHALLVDPNSIEQISAALFRATQDHAWRQRARVNGIQRAKLFTWESVAEKFLGLYDEVGGGTPAGAASGGRTAYSR
ncbi:glycosyltransferase family 1 protein [uncultured Paludibaculum sp.]|uniref:glycosyltransferase family 4 protein n=1 Tax=uncultured Paludibaculum sp. TaxID=1765020 RepID=UPI002AAAEC64|nr:glycosyltransferase family 1 protein [uncultured Paludibaculum sp.]